MSASRLEMLLEEKARRQASGNSPKPVQNNIEPLPENSNVQNSRLERLLAEKQRRMGKNEQPYTLGQRVAQVGHGVANTYESLADLVPKGMAATLVATNPSSYGLPTTATPEEEENREEAIQYLEKPHAGGLITKPIEKLAGRSLKPTEEDTTGRILHTAGEFLAPLPGAGLMPAAKAGIKPLAKHLGNDAVIAGGASTALEATPSFTKEGSIGRGVEDLAKVLTGSIAGRKLSGKAGEIASDINRLASQGRFKETLKSIPSKIAGKTLSAFSKPNENVLGLASKHGIELPVNVGMGSTPLNWIANNYNKSVFAGQAYKEVVKNADEKMIGKVNEAIDLLGTSHLKPSEASQAFRQFLKEDEKLFKSESSKLYDISRESLKDADAVFPAHTEQSLKGAQEILNRDIQSPGTKKVVNILADLAEKWGMVPKNQTIRIGDDKIVDEKILEKIFRSPSLKKPISISRLDDVRKELNQIIDFDPDAKGAEAFLGRLVKDIEKDIQSSSNKEFVLKRKQANKFYYDNLATRFKTELAESILHGEAPVEAFSEMNSVQNIKLFEKIAGESEKGKEIFNQLKQTKLREILESATTSGGLEKGSLGTAQFSKLFNKKEGKQEIIEALLPNKKAYNDLSDIATIAQEFSDSGRELLNTSGSALVHADMDRIMKVATEGLKVLFGQSAVGTATGVALGPLAGATVGIMGPRVTSKLMSNPKIVSQARAYALARNKGQDKYAETILKRLFEMTKPEAKNVLLQANKIPQEEEKEKVKE